MTKNKSENQNKSWNEENKLYLLALVKKWGMPESARDIRRLERTFKRKMGLASWRQQIRRVQAKATLSIDGEEIGVATNPSVGDTVQEDLPTLEPAAKVPIEKATPELVGRTVECIGDEYQLREGGLRLGKKYKVANVTEFRPGEGCTYIVNDHGNEEGVNHAWIHNFTLCPKEPTSESKTDPSILDALKLLGRYIPKEKRINMTFPESVVFVVKKLKKDTAEFNRIRGNCDLEEGQSLGMFVDALVKSECDGASEIESLKALMASNAEKFAETVKEAERQIDSLTMQPPRPFPSCSEKHHDVEEAIKSADRNRDRAQLAESRLYYALSDDFIWLTQSVDKGEHAKAKTKILRELVMKSNPDMPKGGGQ